MDPERALELNQFMINTSFFGMIALYLLLAVFFLGMGRILGKVRRAEKTDSR